MKFKDTYTTEDEKAKEENKDKKVISQDAYAIGELLEVIMLMLRRLK